MVASLPDPLAARPSRALPLLALLLAPAVLDAASPRALPRGTNVERVITLDAESQEIDLSTNHVVLRDVTISQGGTSIKAREAEADSPELSFDDSRWEFRGDVRIRFANGSLAADEATVSFDGNRIARADAKGSPAKIEQKLQNRPEPALGEAGNIDYDILAGRVTLTNGIRFTYGRDEYRSSSLVYNVREQRVQSGGAAAQAPNGGRINITILPEEDKAAPAETPVP